MPTCNRFVLERIRSQHCQRFLFVANLTHKLWLKDLENDLVIPFGRC